MVKKCEVVGCGTTEDKLPIDCNLVPFPDDKDLRQPVWIEFVKGKGSTWLPQAKSRICTLHFESQHFFNNKRKARLLKGAVPTLGPRRIKVRLPKPTIDTTAETSSWSAAAQSLNGTLPSKIQANFNALTNGRSISEVLNYMKVEEEEYLNKVQLKRSVKGLLIHVDDLCYRHQNDPIKEAELKSMKFILLKILNNVGLSPREALALFQNQVPEKYFNQLRRLVKVEKKQFKALVRSFSLSLHFYSQPAYSYTRQKLRGAIPHPRTIQSWYTTIDKYMPSQ